MSATIFVAAQAATGTTGSDGLAVFTFSADIDTTNHEILVDRLPQGLSIDYTVTAARQVTFVAPSIPVTGARIWLRNGVVGTSATTALPAWDTVAEIVSDTAIELGLISTALTDPYASTDPNILQLLALLKSGGRKLARMRGWTHLQKEYTFATVASTATYALPSDFKDMIPQTGWNRTTVWPTDPISPQRWQYLKAVPVTSTLYVEFRQQGGQIVITPTPTSAQTIAYEYLSTSWVKPTGQTTPTSDMTAVATDVVCFDNLLAVTMLKVAYLRAKKMDYSAEQEDYESALAQAKSADATAPVLDLSGSSETPLLGYYNLPDTGYGS